MVGNGSSCCTCKNDGSETVVRNQRYTLEKNNKRNKMGKKSNSSTLFMSLTLYDYKSCKSGSSANNINYLIRDVHKFLLWCVM